jgi:hypothetical protein
MLQHLQAWLSGKRSYWYGVVLYTYTGDSLQLLNLFKKGESIASLKRLTIELQAIYEAMLSAAAGNAEGDIIAAVNTSPALPNKDSGATEEPANKELYTACKTAADNKYKEVMNIRAELFAMSRSTAFDDVNTPDKIEKRAPLAIAVVTGYQEASRLYDVADYVKQHGVLPAGSSLPEETNCENIPDHLVKQSLDNLRKNVNKMKKRTQTPDRVALLQKHQGNIEKLIIRWNNIKPNA